VDAVRIDGWHDRRPDWGATVVMRFPERDVPDLSALVALVRQFGPLAGA
jgi:hypothetical protein